MGCRVLRDFSGRSDSHWRIPWRYLWSPRDFRIRGSALRRFVDVLRSCSDRRTAPTRGIVRIDA